MYINLTAYVILWRTFYNYHLEPPLLGSPLKQHIGVSTVRRSYLDEMSHIFVIKNSVIFFMHAFTANAIQLKIR